LFSGRQFSIPVAPRRKPSDRFAELKYGLAESGVTGGADSNPSP